MNKTNNGTVLVVDDEAANLDILFEHLREANFRVLVAEDGASALERVKRTRPDIALLDVNLPDIDGFELCLRLKAIDAIKDMPIIFLTVKEEVADKVKALEMSAVDYITKPFAPEEVLARVDKHLALHNLQVQLESQNAQLQFEIAERKQWEEKNRSLLLLLDTLDGTCFIKNKDGSYQYINKAFETQFGVKREEVIGKDDVLVFGPEIAVMLQENDQRIMASKIPESVEEAGTLPSGKIVFYLTNKTPIFDENGEVSGICGVGVDITHQKEIEEQLRLSEEKYRVLVEHSHDVVYAVGMDGKITYIDLQMAQYGYAIEDVIGKSVFEFIAPEQREEIRHIFQELVISGDSTPVRFQWLRKDGSRSWVEVVANTVYDASGNALERIGIMRNITLQMEMENKLRESSTRLASVIDSAMDAIITIDEEQIVVMFNPAATQMFGYSEAEIVGRPLSKLMPERHKIGHTDYVQAFGQTNVSNRRMKALGSLWGRRANGEEFPIEVAISQVKISGQKLYTAIARDITERKQGEKRLEEAIALAERERIARDLHDAVTQSIFMAASIAETLPQVWQSKPDEARRGLDELRRLTMGALAEMRNMLIELHPSALTERTLGVLLKQLCDGLMARTKMLVTVSVAGDCHLPDEVQIALYRIAQEALNNIVKHAHARRAIVRLDCTLERAQLSIEDNGRGFIADAVGADHMGVSNMSERAQAIGAEFKLDSKPGQGTKIGVRWGKWD